MRLPGWRLASRDEPPELECYREGRNPEAGRESPPKREKGSASRGVSRREGAPRSGASRSGGDGRPRAEEGTSRSGGGGRPRSLNGASPRSEGGCVRTKSLRPEALGHARRLPWASAASSRSCRRQAQRAEPCALPCGYAPSKRSLVSAMMAPRSRASSSRAAASASSVACRRDRQACASHANPSCGGSSVSRSRRSAETARA